MRTLAREIAGDNGGIEGSKAQGESKIRERNLLERLIKSPETALIYQNENKFTRIV